MSQKANPTAIGLFIVAGFALGLVGILLFSSMRLFATTQKCIVYFDSSLNGLNESAPVKYRGVTIGSVKRVFIHYNQSTNDFAMPVLIELQENLVHARLGKEVSFEELTQVQADVNRGLRATLQAESLLTGVLYVDLNTLPDAPPPKYHQLKPLYVEIPSVPPQIQELMKNLARLDIKGLEEKLTALTTNLTATLENLNAPELSREVTHLLSTLNQLVASPALTNTLAALPETVGQYRLLAENLNRRLDPLADDVTNTLAEATQTLAQLRAGVQNLNVMLSPDAPLRGDVARALEQLAAAAQSVSALADFLQAHPNALLTRRQSPSQKP